MLDPNRTFRDEWLVSLARLSHQVPEQFIEGARSAGHPYLATALLRAGRITPDALGSTVEQKLGCRFVMPNAPEIDRAVLKLVPERICRRHMVLPVAAGKGGIVVATANPTDLQLEDELRFATGRKAIMAYCPPEHLEDLIGRMLGADEVIYDLLRSLNSSQNVEWVHDVRPDDQDPARIDAPVIKLVHALIGRAVELRASDIHIEHEEKASQVRYRVDGTLRTGMRLPRYLAAGPIVSRLKIMATLDVAERRRPQDGQLSVRVGAAPITLRISTLPTHFGEKVVARVLDARNARAGLSEIGFRPEIAAELDRQLHKDQGLVLVTGPTGSGKTTTLYAAIASLTDGTTNIVSIEDPIEYELPGINQVQVNVAQGLTFASVLRSTLRQDPDVILVGEIRDRETADIACQAALTGHLVLSTLHTNDTVAAIARLADIGVDRYKVLSSLLAVAAQRLSPRLCACRTNVQPNDLPAAIQSALRRFGFPPVGFAAGRCSHCSFTGLSDRVVIGEILHMTPALAERLARADTAGLRDAATELGLLESMEKDALWHMTQGHISVEEASLYLEHHEGGAAPAPPSSRTKAAAPHPRVLLAHNEAVDRDRISQLLSAAGYQVTAVGDGASAISSIALHSPDALITSVQLPMIAGIDLIKYVRGTLGLTALPLIATLADTDVASYGVALSAPADDVLFAADLEKMLVPALTAAWSRNGDFSPLTDISTPRRPAAEPDRLAALQRTKLFDTPSEERFDAITRLAAKTFEAPMALVTLVGDERVWIKSDLGFGTNEGGPRDNSFCAHSILDDDVMVINDAVLDPRFSQNPAVVGDPSIRFYAGYPLSAPDGQRLGSLCVIDRKPRIFTDTDKQALKDLGRLVEREIAASAAS